MDVAQYNLLILILDVDICAVIAFYLLNLIRENAIFALFEIFVLIFKFMKRNK